ncbi:5519_t:CDS:1 [Racocetra persica]|uniref:5519_t:CDS:1 n=1 Tax=Racocetra persica TaxID=160502 RepID=A0ACA9RJE6_9GLOM|nr:5519_t:CDS:1 [Racocetra persica]
MYYLLPNRSRKPKETRKSQIHEIKKEEFLPSKKLKVTTKIEEFNFEKIERTEIEQMKTEINNLKKLTLEQSENIKYLAKAIKIHQEINNTLHLDNIELKRKLEKHREHNYLTKLRQITTWRNQAITEYIILGQQYLEEKFDKIHKEYLANLRNNNSL